MAKLTPEQKVIEAERAKALESHKALHKRIGFCRVCGQYGHLCLRTIRCLTFRENQKTTAATAKPNGTDERTGQF